jgi:hypothetical protein
MVLFCPGIVDDITPSAYRRKPVMAKDGFLKTHHLKFIDGILHQLHEPHPNITDKTPEWVPVESETTAAARETKADPADTSGASGETKASEAGTGAPAAA